MRFTSVVLSLGLLFSTAVFASPVPAAQPISLRPRVTLCEVGLPCWTQDQLSATLKLADAAVKFAGDTQQNVAVPVGQICGLLAQAQKTGLDVSATLTAKLSAMVVEDSAKIQTQIFAAVSLIVKTIWDDALYIQAQVVDASGSVNVAVAGVQDMIASIEAIIGKCTS